MRKNLKVLGLKANVTYDDKHYIFDENAAVKICCDKDTLLVNELNETARIYGKCVKFEDDEEEYSFNNQLFSGKDTAYAESLQGEYFNSVFKDTVHEQIAYNIDKIKKVIGYYINSVVYFMNSVAKTNGEDILSTINYFVTWENFDPSKNGTTINNKIEFKEYVFEICQHNELFSNIFKCKKVWRLSDYLAAEEEIHEYNYDILRIISLLRQFSAHGTKRLKDSFYVLCSNDMDLKEQNIPGWERLEEILRNNAGILGRRVVYDVEKISNDIYKTLYIFNYNLKKNIFPEFDSIFETIYFADYLSEYPLKKVCHYILDRIVTDSTMNLRDFKYYVALSKSEKTNLELVLYFFLLQELSDKQKKTLSRAYRERRNIKELSGIINNSKVIAGKVLHNLIKTYYVVVKSDVSLYAREKRCTVFEQTQNRGFDANYGELDKKMYHSYLLTNHFETKAQDLCNINKVATYPDDKRVRDLKYKGELLRKLKIKSILVYIKYTQKYKYWYITERNFQSEYEKNRYLQIRRSIVERVILPYLYLNRKYYQDFVKNDNNIDFISYLSKKDKGWIGDRIKSFCYDYDKLEDYKYTYSKKSELYQIDIFTLAVVFLGNFLDKSNFNQMVNSLQVRMGNIAEFMDIWGKLDDRNVSYKDSLGLFTDSVKISNNLNAIRALVHLKPQNFDGYENVIRYVSTVAEKLNLKWAEDDAFLQQVYRRTKYFNSIIRYVNPDEIDMIINNRNLMRYAICGLNKNEKNRYEKIFDSKLEINTLLQNSKKMTITEAVELFALLGSSINSLVGRMLRMNSNYYLAFSFLERDRDMLGGKNKSISVAKKTVANIKNRKYVFEFNNRIESYDENCFSEYRNAVEHMGSISMLSKIADIAEIDCDFTLYHYLLQNYLFTEQAFKKTNQFVASEKYTPYFKLIKQYHKPSRDLLKIMNLPFAYKPSRYNKLSYKSVFNEMETKFDDSKRFF